jgi:hypothetical protein
VKANLSDRFRDAFVLDENVYVEDRTFGRRRELEGEHVQRAEATGRQAYVARSQAGEHQPEMADSGCPVFGRDGIVKAQVSVAPLFDELRAAGYTLSRMSVLERTNKRPVLITEWSSSEALEAKKLAHQFFPPTDGQLVALDRFVNAAFDQVHVWANAREESGRVVHTVNLGARTEAVPQHVLRFATGDWAVESNIAEEVLVPYAGGLPDIAEEGSK